MTYTYTFVPDQYLKWRTWETWKASSCLYRKNDALKYNRVWIGDMYNEIVDVDYDTQGGYKFTFQSQADFTCFLLKVS